MRKSKLKIIFIIFAIYFVLDLSLTNLIFKKTNYGKALIKLIIIGELNQKFIIMI